RPSPTFATTPTAGQAALLPLMALALGAALFLATPAQTPVAAGATPNLESGTESGLVSGPDLSISAATAGRAAPVDSQMRLELIAAAEAGDAGAQYRLAVDHFLGTHPRASDGRALYWYRRAAEQGHVPAQLLLGQMYESGWGVASDRAEAVRWYRRAAASGDILAAGKLRVLGAGEA
ncbi:MAG: tetratricopeptide repeat protein, partial [Pseudomonadota bacterium]|nr:tetratricopeptide repeat protein [Pseudomonadota bacterium]